MKIIEVQTRTNELIENLLEIWEDSVTATHLFLSDDEIKKIKEYVPEAIKNVSHLIIIENEYHKLIAFMGIEDTTLEMLFLKNSERGKGLGKKLLMYGLKKYNVNNLTVNEQNPQALAFYEHMGFKTYKRTELDEQGNAYPILYMTLKR